MPQRPQLIDTKVITFTEFQKLKKFTILEVAHAITELLVNPTNSLVIKKKLIYSVHRSFKIRIGTNGNTSCKDHLCCLLELPKIRLEYRIILTKQNSPL